jgi:hypothetical protein
MKNLIRMASPLVLEHNGGHVIAGTPLIRKRIASFLEGSKVAEPERSLSAELRHLESDR